MNRFATVCLVVLAAALIVCGNAFAAIDLSTSSYSLDVQAGAYDVTLISFDYTYGQTAVPGADFRIRRLNGDGTDSWLGSFNIHTSSFNLDTDYGPYSSDDIGLLSGNAHYEFTLNRSNGLWDLSVNGALVDFYPILSGTSITANPQPNGDAVAAGTIVSNKFFSDESLASGQNALALGWATLSDDGTHLEGNARDGVGGTGAYRIYFSQSVGASVDNVAAYNVPEPSTLVVWTVIGAIALGLGWQRYRK